jgi:hypothetical protein
MSCSFEHKKQRALLLQAHGVLTCLYEVLLHREGEAVVSYAQATYVARNLVDRGAEQLDFVCISPLLDALANSNSVDESRVFRVRGGKQSVRSALCGGAPLEHHSVLKPRRSARSASCGFQFSGGGCATLRQGMPFKIHFSRHSA